MAKTKVELQNYQGESLSPITIASNVLYEDGRNAQEVFEEYSNETFTPTIENSSSMFKVGQGDSVDYSGNIVNGAYESMVLKGKTMVNCIQEPSSKDVVLPYEFEEGQYVTINDTKESGALGVVLKGQTLVNTVAFKQVNTNASFDNATNVITLVDSTGWIRFDETRIKPSTKYIIIIDILECTLGSDSRPLKISLGDGTLNTVNITSEQFKVGRIIVTETTPSTILTNYFNAQTRTGSSCKFKLMVIEYQDGMENWDIPYFTGMQSVKMPVLTTIGKNLFDMNIMETSKTEDGWTYKRTGNLIHFTSDGTKTYQQYRLDITNHLVNKIKLGKPYYFTSDISKNITNDAVSICQLMITNKDGSKSYYESPMVFTLNKEFSQIFIRIIGHNRSEAGIPSDFTIKNIQLEEGSAATPYEPYKSNILTVNEEVELRGIGDVQDTLDCLTGEVTERIGEIVLDGSENWRKNDIYSGTSGSRFVLYIDDIKKEAYGKILCDKMQVNSNVSSWQTEGEYISADETNISNINIRKTQDMTIEEFKQWLSQDPITVQYELAQESVKTVDLSIIDQNGSVIPTLKSWNTTTHIYSKIPENTLYPTLTHSNPTYPVILKPSTKYSIVANSYSNNHTNSTINFNLGGATATTTVGNRVTTITTPSALSNELLTMSGRGNKLNNVMVIEGDVAGDEPYFEGMCDSKSPILSNVGKNLCHINDYTITISNSNPSGTHSNSIIATNIPVKANTRYRVYFDTISWFDQNVGRLNVFIDSQKTTLETSNSHSNLYHQVHESGRGKETGGVMSGSVITTDSQTRYIHLSLFNMVNVQGKTVTFNNISLIEESPTSSTYEPHKSNTTTFDQKDDKTIVLRSLPNGVCDTLNIETGEYVQRIAQYTLTGNETNAWNISNDSSGGAAYFTVANIIPEVRGTDGLTGNLISDTFHNDNPYHVKRHERCIGAYQTHIRIKIPEIELSVNSYKNYFRNNPTTIQYELATPIVSTIDVQGFPYAYTNGHVQLTSGHSGQSLTPKVEYSVATNRNGQIRSNQKMVERHQKQLDQLQAIILANMVNTQYQQTLTTLNYDLLKKEVGE